MVGERDVGQDLVGAVALESGPAAVGVLHPLEPGRATLDRGLALGLIARARKVHLGEAFQDLGGVVAIGVELVGILEIPAAERGLRIDDLAVARVPDLHAVISNARTYRMQDEVPLLIPEVNPDHTALIERQRWGRGGFIVTNPNCSTVGLVCALKPLVDAFGVEAVQVTTLQALSGAGYPGVASLDALGNVVPYIGGEEEKMATEPLKLLGRLAGGRVEPASFTISAQCNRVPVLEGHLECLSVKLRREADVEAVRAAFLGFRSPIDGLDLPSAPERLFHVFDEAHFPQPRRHADLGGGMTVSIGRIRPCPVLDVKFVALVHNTVRGAAGGAVLNAELLIRQGYLKHRQARVAATV